MNHSIPNSQYQLLDKHPQEDTCKESIPIFKKKRKDDAQQNAKEQICRE